MPILTDEERIGTIVGNKYRLDKILGRGGMGVVYAGQHTGTGRAVAVKILLPEYARDKEIARRFVLEARTAGQLTHKSIVDVLDVGRDETDGTVFLVLELLDGEVLADVLARHGTLPARVAIEMLRPIMDALSVAHRARVVHRDIKPGNIYLCRKSDGTIEPKLLDFGLAKVVGARASKATRAGSVLGTVEYMSPEQAAGKDDIDWQTDVWSIGVVLFECITGNLPFDAKTPAAMVAAIMTKPARSLLELAPNMVPALAKAIDRALLADRAERYASMEAFAAALDGVIPLLPEIPEDDEHTKVQWVRRRDGGIAPPQVPDAGSVAFAPPGAATALLFSGEGPVPLSTTPAKRSRRVLVALAAAGLSAAALGTIVGVRLRGTPGVAPSVSAVSTAPSGSSTGAPAPGVPTAVLGASSPGAPALPVGTASAYAATAAPTAPTLAARAAPGALASVPMMVVAPGASAGLVLVPSPSGAGFLVAAPTASAAAGANDPSHRAPRSPVARPGHAPRVAPTAVPAARPTAAGHESSGTARPSAPGIAREW